MLWRVPEINIDASRYFTEAKFLEIYGIKAFLQAWGEDLRPWLDLPAVPFSYGLIFKFLGESRIFIQILTTLFFSFSLLLTNKIGKKLWNDRIGFYAGFLLLGFPFLLSQIPFMMVDIPAMFFLLLSLYGCINILEKGAKKWKILTPVAIFWLFSLRFQYGLCYR